MSYKVLYQAGEDEIEEKKSRFIAHTLPVNSEDEAVAFLNKIKKEYWDARHNCYAYTIGRNNECTRCSDDGEPSGTAGPSNPGRTAPGRNPQLHRGSHTLFRRYPARHRGARPCISGCHTGRLAASYIIEKQFGKKLHLTTDYTGIGKLQYLIAQNQVFTLDTRYTDSVTIDLMVPEEKFADFCAQVTEATSGQAQMDSEDLEEFGIVNGEIIF